MKYSLLSYAVFALLPAVLGQNNTFLEGFLDSLLSADLNSFASAVSSLNASSQGKELLTAISSGDPYLIFAPNNTAFSDAPSNLTANVTDLLAYHIVSGNFSGASTTYPNITLGRTFLNDSAYVHLEGNKSQVVAWAVRPDGKSHVLNQKNDTAVTNVTTYGNLTIYITNSTLEFPGTFLETVPYDNASLFTLETILSNVTVPFFNSSTGSSNNTSVLTIVDEGFHGFTLFAPNSSALVALASSSGSLQSNATLLEIVLDNHLINGTTVYSPELVGTNYTTAAGETLSFHINSTGQYVTSGNTTALIIQPDVLLSNGVVHVIDQVLLNSNENTSAASSAFASATSVAAISSTESRPIGYSQTASVFCPCASVKPSPSSSSAASGSCTAVVGKSTSGSSASSSSASASSSSASASSSSASAASSSASAASSSASAASSSAASASTSSSSASAASSSAASSSAASSSAASSSTQSSSVSSSAIPSFSTPSTSASSTSSV